MRVARGLALAAVLVLAVSVESTVVKTRAFMDGYLVHFEGSSSLVARIPDQRAIVFARYAPDHDFILSFVRNPSDPATARARTTRTRTCTTGSRTRT